MGCACLDGESSDLSQAGNYFRRALTKANELMLFSEPGNPFTTETNRLASITEHDMTKERYVYQRGEYDEGMHGYSDPVTLHADVVSTKNAATTIVFNLGQLYLRLNDDDEALKSF